jgi:hypothetical protein
MGLEGSAEGEVVSERKHLCEDGKIRCKFLYMMSETAYEADRCPNATKI